MPPVGCGHSPGRSQSQPWAVVQSPGAAVCRGSGTKPINLVGEAGRGELLTPIMKLSNLKRKLLSQPERLRLDFEGGGEACTGGAPTAVHLEMRPALPMVSREKQHRGT